MINKDDRIISMLLYNSTESDMTYQRPDMTTYICQIRKNKPNTFRIPETQLQLPLWRLLMTSSLLKTLN